MGGRDGRLLSRRCLGRWAFFFNLDLSGDNSIWGWGRCSLLMGVLPRQTKLEGQVATCREDEA